MKIAIETPDPARRLLERMAGAERRLAKIERTRQLVGAWHVVGDSGEPTFQNGWLNYDTASFGYTKFRKYADGTVRVQGIIKSGTIGAGVPVFTLPAGYRPDIEVRFATPTGAPGFAFVQVRADGVLAVVSGSTAWTGIDLDFAAA